MGLSVLAASPAVRAVKNVKKKARKQGKKKRQKQIEQCRDFWGDYCELTGAVNCEELEQPVADCCEFPGQCQMVEFFDCLAEAENGREPE